MQAFAPPCEGRPNNKKSAWRFASAPAIEGSLSIGSCPSADSDHSRSCFFARWSHRGCELRAPLAGHWRSGVLAQWHSLLFGVRLSSRHRPCSPILPSLYGPCALLVFSPSLL